MVNNKSLNYVFTLAPIFDQDCMNTGFHGNQIGGKVAILVFLLLNMFY